MSGVCFVDTETTGLDPDRHEVWNVGLITPDGKEREWFLPVRDLAAAEPIALRIGHYFERSPDGGRRDYDEGDAPGWTAHWEFARDFMAATWGHHLAGAVVSFDEERLRRLLKAHGACPGWHYHLIDVEALAVGRLATQIPERAQYGTEGAKVAAQWREVIGPPWKSEALSRAVGVEPDNFDRHTALGDARWAKAIYDAVMS